MDGIGTVMRERFVSKIGEWGSGGQKGSWTRRDCHFADVPSPSLLKHLLQEEGGAAE